MLSRVKLGFLDEETEFLPILVEFTEYNSVILGQILGLSEDQRVLIRHVLVNFPQFLLKIIKIRFERSITYTIKKIPVLLLMGLNESCLWVAG